MRGALALELGLDLCETLISPASSCWLVVLLHEWVNVAGTAVHAKRG